MSIKYTHAGVPQYSPLTGMLIWRCDMANDSLIIKPKRGKGDDGYRVFAVRVKEETVSKIDDVAFETGRSRNELIGLFLEYAVSHCIIEK